MHSHAGTSEGRFVHDLGLCCAQQQIRRRCLESHSMHAGAVMDLNRFLEEVSIHLSDCPYVCQSFWSLCGRCHFLRLFGQSCKRVFRQFLVLSVQVWPQLCRWCGDGFFGGGVFGHIHPKQIPISTLTPFQRYFPTISAYEPHLFTAPASSSMI